MLLFIRCFRATGRQLTEGELSADTANCIIGETVRKRLSGALEREVLLQFLVEAVALSSFGGLLGVALALGASVRLAAILRVPFVFNVSIVVIAFLFSAAVGVIFGYFPALKAARLDPIEALRHE